MLQVQNGDGEDIPQEDIPQDDIPQSNQLPTYSISGKAWKDEKTLTNDFGILKGDGIYQDGENLIEGITVNLYKEDSPNTIYASTFTQKDGTYSFNVSEAGKYKVDFIYGNNTNLEYNGQDYKTTNINTSQPTCKITTLNTPIDIVFLIDLSNSMTDEKISAIKESLITISQDSINQNNDVRIAILSFSTNPKIECSFTNDINTLISTINRLTKDSTTNTASALKFAHNYINSYARENAEKYLFTFTDGLPDMTYFRRSSGNEVTTSVQTGSRNVYALMLYGWYYNNSNELINSYHSSLHNTNISFTTPILEEGSYDISRVPIKYEDAIQDLYIQTSRKWNELQNDTSISSYVIAAYSNSRVAQIFNQIFGNSEHVIMLSNTASSIRSFFSDSLTKYFYENNTKENVLYATDSQERRLEVMNYSSKIDYNKALILNRDTNYINEFKENTYMIASTPYFYVNNFADSSNVNLALEERPKASVEIKKNVSHLTITLSDGNTLIDWPPNQNVPNPKVKNLMVIPDTSLTAIMDDEITHGATIQIQYKIKLTNTSENDNLSNYFTRDFIQSIDTNNNNNIEFKKLLAYYKSNNLQDIMNNIIPTSYYIYDYLDNNSIFDQTNSPDWSIVSDTLPISDSINLNSQTILEVGELNNIYLKPQGNGEDEATIELSTSKLMTIADEDLLTYNNYVEVVQYSSVLGRRIYDTIPGNFDIYDDNRELEKDEAKAETVSRVPPFGKDLSYYTTIVGIIILAIEIVVLSTLKIKIKHLKSRYIRR